MFRCLFDRPKYHSLPLGRTGFPKRGGGLGFRVWGFGFGGWGGFRVWALGFGVFGFGVFWVWGVGFGV